MRNQANMPLVLEDAYVFCDMLGDNFGIQMYPNHKLNVYFFIGEFYTYKGLPLRLTISVYPVKTDIRVCKMDRQCVYQKSYSTVSDSRALSKSTGLFKFIKRAYETM